MILTLLNRRLSHFTSMVLVQFNDTINLTA
ncbi:hypothetical protein DSUL_50118 [Desulfovibrionales bacterium]